MMINKVNPFSILSFVAFLLFILGSIFENKYATYPYMACVWFIFILNIFFINTTKEKKSVTQVDIVVTLGLWAYLAYFQAWWTLFPVIGIDILSYLRTEKEVKNA
ncbi:hypothetical protein [Desulfovibrio sp. UCD-KL4C]|uniref:hypothetical protein n=1 Tax=Desulfovibrio sp. UCD-KL4C TaxID=2578120 RepID=UPI0025C173B9|nr:hypothetical protein [Desulfovibrio sp. UCD-KL4C]